MTDNVEVTPFFRRGENSRDGLPAETYVAGFRCAKGTAGGVEVTLPAEMVDRIVLTGAQLSLSLSPEGRVVLDGEGLSDDMLMAASTAGGMREQTLESLVAACLNLDLLAGDLTALRGQLVRALAQLDATMEQLKKRPQR